LGGGAPPSAAEAGRARFDSPAGRWIIAATVLGSAVAAIDSTVVGIALPSIGRYFHASLGTLQWVVTGYTLTLASLMLIGGSLGDHWGRRRVFQIGIAWFTVASAGCALAPTSGALLATRILQGVGAALLTPGSLAIIEASFRPDDQGRAVGAWSGLGGVATAAGPLLGGYLVAAASWRWIFLINLPIGVVVLVMSARHVPESRDEQAPAGMDVVGAVLAVLALGGITFALIEGPDRGWSNPLVIAMLLIGVAAGVAFGLVEARSPHPMLPLGVFRVRQFSVTNLVTFILYGALGGVLFLLPVQLQVVNHYTPFQSGVALLPLTVIMLLLSARSGQLAGRIGPRLQMSVGPIVVGAGLALLSRTANDSSYVTVVLPAIVVFGLGLACTVAPLTMTALTALPEHQAGLASAVNNDVARTGYLIAVAVLPALAGMKGTTYLHPSQFAAGFQTAVFIAAATCGVAGIVAGLGIRNPVRVPAAAEGAVPAEAVGAGCFHCALDATPLATGS
jgi:EmrB/QacA subfamily drug resistance transporter